MLAGLVIVWAVSRWRREGPELEFWRVTLRGVLHRRGEELAREIVTADPPGLTTLRVEIFPKHKKPGPLWPMDDEVQYRPRVA